MGFKQISGKCILSRLDGIDINFNNSNWSGYEYQIKVNGEKQTVFLTDKAENWMSNPFFKENKHIIAGLIRNNNFFDNDNEFIEDLEIIRKKISKII